MGWSIFLLLTSLYFSANSSYVPGDKGAPWTEEEVPMIITIITIITISTIITTTIIVIITIIFPKMLVVRAKLWRLFSGGDPLEQALNTEIIIITITITIHHTIALDSAVWKIFWSTKNRPTMR